MVAGAVGLALAVQAFIVKPYKIPSPSMSPTLQEKQRVLADRLTIRFNKPSVGDILVFHPPIGALKEPTFGDSARDLVKAQCGKVPETGSPCQQESRGVAKVTFIKRLVGMPGDRIAIVDGRVIRNGQRASEPYANLSECLPEKCNFPKAITVPPGHYYLLGDNRGNSDDGRFWGAIDQEQIIGRAFATYWPINRIGLLN